MGLESHISSLRQRHAELDRKIQQEESRHFFDSVAVARMKVDKLHIKEEIQRLTQA
jgi:hypothetical protein